MPKMDKKLYEAVRAKGLRKRVARSVAEAANGAERDPDALRKAVEDLRAVAADLEDRAAGGPEKRRREAGKKAARTRKHKAAERSAAAKRAARTRARS